VDRALLRHLSEPLPWCELGSYPTPVEPLPVTLGPFHPAVQTFVKRDDLGSTVYGGNKVRSLELLLANAREQGANVVCTGGASGSNYVLATALHAPAAGLEARGVLFPQPPGPTVRENLPVIRAQASHLRWVRHWSLLPPALLLERLTLGRHGVVLPPGGSSPLGVLGHVSAALELAEQVQAGDLPAPDVVVVGLGSGGTSAGLLLGFQWAAELRLGFVRPPELVAVRVAPWPLASRTQVLRLAWGAARLLHRLSPRPPQHLERLTRGLTVDGAQLGRGYGHATPEGLGAIEQWSKAHLPELDPTYSAKAAAAFLARARARRAGTLLFWSTKSSAALPNRT
jgi:D-cysteine desulfhydrase